MGDTGKHLSLFLVNHSDWMVRAGAEVSVKGEILGYFGSAGHVFKSEGAWGWPDCVRLSRCYNNDDLLSHDGILTIDVKVKVLAEKTSEGGGDVQRQLSILTKTQEQLSVMNKSLEKLSAVKKEMSGLHGKLAYQKRKLDTQDAELNDLRSKFRLIEMKKRNY